MSRHRPHRTRRRDRPGLIAQEDTTGRSVRCWWLAGTLAVTLAVWATTFSGAAGLGDGPESVAGAEVFGVLHAPGYILYSGLGWASIRILGFLPAATALSVLSVAASLGTVAVTFLIAQRLGATKLGAAVAGILLGVSGPVWFYSSYAKHTTLTTLLAASLIYVTVLLYDEATPRRVLTAGGLLGASLGFGWPVIATVAPVTVWVSWRRGGWRPVGLLAGSAVVLGVVVAGLIFWRSSQSPAVNWGGVDSLSRLFDLLLMRDFGLLSSAETAALSTLAAGSRLLQLPGHLLDFFVVLGRSVGILTVGLACIAFFTGTARRLLPLVSVAAVNLVAVSFVLGIEDRSLDSVLIMGGFIAPALVAASGLAGVDTSRLTAHDHRIVRFVGVGLAGAAVVVAVVGHHGAAVHPDEDLALIYANDVFDEVDENGVVVTWFAERAFPLTYAQIIHGLRPDVTVVAADGLATDWYRQQVSAQGLQVVEKQSLEETLAASVARWTNSGQPVYLDIAAWLNFRDSIPARIEGIVALASADKRASWEAPETVLALTSRPFMDDPLLRRWPNQTVMSAYPRAAVIIAEFALASGDIETGRRLLRTALRLNPDNEVVRRVLDQLLPTVDSQ